MVSSAPPSTAGLTPDPVALCTHISRLNRELRLARRLLRLTIEARQAESARPPHPANSREAAHAAR